jgi:tetratricopeptide (TPR) repeat protein
MTATRSAMPAAGWTLLVAMLTLLVFLPSLRFPFFPFWDDDIHVHANPHIAELSWAGLATLWSGPWQQLYIPLTYSTWAALAALSRWTDGGSIVAGPLNAVWFHGANVLVHTLSAVLVWFLLRRVAAQFFPSLAGTRLNLAAALGAFLFALHPLQVEPVAWISGLRDVLGGALGLAALVVLFGRAQPGPARWMGASVLFVASLAAKPAGVALPLVAGVLAFMPFRWPGRQIVLRLGPWVIFAALWVLLTSRAQWAAELAAGLVPLWARPLVGADALAFYLGKTILPLGLAADYGRAPDAAWAAGWLWWTWLGPVALAVVLVLVRPLRLYLVPLAIFFTALLPTLGLVPFNFQLVSTVADRYAYFALLGPALALTMVVGQTQRRWVTALAVVWIAALTSMTAQRLPLWSEDLRLFEATLTVNPQSWKARHNYASALDDRGRTAEAEPHMRQVIAQRPDSAEAFNDLAVMVWTLGRQDEATTLMRESLRLRPTANTARNLAIMEGALGNTAAQAEAARLWRELEATEPR